MPFYEYECQNCKFYIELLQKVSDAPLKKCPSCGKSAMKKLVSAPVFRLKGSGWYETDFKGDKENKRNLAVEKDAEPASGDSKPATAASDAKAGDTKPAAEAKPAEPKAAAGGASEGGSRKVAARSGTPGKSAKPAAKPKVKPKAKAKAAARGRRR
jgi:putative FmdB family regulatory protein